MFANQNSEQCAGDSVAPEASVKASSSELEETNEKKVAEKGWSYKCKVI